MVFLLPAVLHASVADEVKAIDSERAQCIAKDGSTLGTKECTDSATQKVDLILNREYKKTVDRLNVKSDDDQANLANQETLKRLINSERAWISFRNADSSLMGIEMLGGSGEAIATMGSYYEMTKSRVIQLDGLFN